MVIHFFGGLLAWERRGGWGNAALFFRVIAVNWRFLVSKPRYTLAA